MPKREQPMGLEEAEEFATKMQSVKKGLGVDTSQAKLTDFERRNMWADAEKLAEMSATFAAMARVETEEQAEPIGKARTRLEAEKKQEMESKWGVEIGRNDKYIRYKGVEIYDPYSVFIDDEPDWEQLKESGQYTDEVRAYHERFATSKIRFAQRFPKEVQEAVLECYKWFYNVGNIGRDLDTYHAAGLVSDPQYDSIRTAHAEGKVILTGEHRISSSPNDEGWVRYWAIAEKPEEN